MGKASDFQKSFLIGFLATVPLTLGGLHLFSLSAAKSAAVLAPAAAAPARQHEIDVALTASFPKKYFDEEARNPVVSKDRKTFWVHRSDQPLRGAALRMLENPELLPLLFPGYPAEMARDRGLWDRYFRHEFNCESWMPALSKDAKQGVLMAYSWTGCFDVYKRYGADVIVFGSSEVFRDVVPSLLSSELGGLKVLMCTTAAMPLEAVRRSARELRRLGGAKAKLVIWGFEAWNAYTYSSSRREFIDMKERHYEEYIKNSEGEALWNRLQSYKLSNWFRAPSWDSVVSARDQLPGAKRPSAPEEAEDPIEKISPQVAGDPLALKERVERLPQKPGYFGGMTALDCDLRPAEREVRATLHELEKVAERTLVYITPVLPKATNAAPGCFLPELKKMLARKETSKVLVSTRDWSDYGLEYGDYLWPKEDGSGFTVDTNHTNFGGAMKFTRRLASLAKGEER